MVLISNALEGNVILAALWSNLTTMKVNGLPGNQGLANPLVSQGPKAFESSHGLA